MTTSWASDSKGYDTGEGEGARVQTSSRGEQDEREIGSTRIGETRAVTCPSCGHSFHYQLQPQEGIMNDLPGLPAGVKFDPTDQEILVHLEAKVSSDIRRIHPLNDQFIPTLEGEDGICYTHPEKLPGVKKDGQVRHFFHRPSKAYTTGTRKRRKVSTDEHGNETRWHKTGKTRPVTLDGVLKGFKKILVLYTNYGRQKKPEKTNWVMHQYHLGRNEEEREGELVLSKVFYQTQPRQCNSSLKGAISPEKRLSSVIQSGHQMNVNLPLVGYNMDRPALVGYDHGSQSGNRESPPHMIPNLIIRGDGSSFLRLASDPSKRKS